MTKTESIETYRIYYKRETEFRNSSRKIKSERFGKIMCNYMEKQEKKQKIRSEAHARDEWRMSDTVTRTPNNIDTYKTYICLQEMWRTAKYPVLYITTEEITKIHQVSWYWCLFLPFCLMNLSSEYQAFCFLVQWQGFKASKFSLGILLLNIYTVFLKQWFSGFC